LRGH
jgi:hypothetical protein